VYVLEPAVPAGRDPRRHAREIAIERDRVLGGAASADPGVIRGAIRADWQRMRRAGVRPDGAAATLVDDRELAHLRARPDLDLVWTVLCANVLGIAEPDYMVVLTTSGAASCTGAATGASCPYRTVVASRTAPT
jgi:hypothetical protein